MATKILQGKLKKGDNLFAAIRSSLANGGMSTVTGAESFSDFTAALNSVAGQENLNVGSMLGAMNPSAFDAFSGAMRRGKSDFVRQTEGLKDAADVLKGVTGFEGFSMQNFEGSEQDIKAANMTLNAQSHRQTDAAEAMFKTITLNYEQEGAELIVRAAGLGNYVYGASAYQSASELRPIFGLLRTGEMFKDEVLALHPIYPAVESDPTREFFVSETEKAATPIDYPQGDAYGRGAHLTQMLKVPVTIPNLLALCQAPNQRPFTSTDEIESNSITVKLVEVKAKVEGKDAVFFVETGAMSNNTFGPGSQRQSSDDRQLNLHVRELPGFSVVDKTGAPVGETIFAGFKAVGFEPLLTFSLAGNFQRQGNELRLTGGQVTIGALKEIATGHVIRMGKADNTQQAWLRKLTDGLVTGAQPSLNVSNTNRGNFGYRIEVYDAVKHLSVRKRSPISVKYPVSKDDVNQDSLDFAINQMSVTINNQCSKDAFDAAFDHLKYITSIDGAAVVGNQQGSNVLPGQHFVTASAVNRTLKLTDVVSANGSTDVFDAVSTAIINELADIAAALNTKSGLAAISEYGGVEKMKWTVVVHQNLSRFLMRQGDARTIGGWDSIEIKETNFDVMIGKMLVIPQNTSGDDSINPLGGIGVNVSKENIVVQGNVTRDQQDFGVVMTLPTYKHWALCPIIGSLIIEDAKDFLGNDGVLKGLAKLRVAVTAADATGLKVDGADAGTSGN